MKKAAFVISILVLALASVGLAQPRGGFGGDCPQGQGGPGMGQRHHMGMGQGFGQRGGGMRAGMGIHMILQHGDDLKLTDQQEERLESMIAEFQTEQIDAKANLEKAQVELRDMMRREAPESDVMVAIDRVTELRGEMHKMAYRHHQQVKGVLTVDQVKQLQELRGDRGRQWFKGWDDDDDDNDEDDDAPRPRRGGRG